MPAVRRGCGGGREGVDELAKPKECKHNADHAQGRYEIVTPLFITSVYNTISTVFNACTHHPIPW